ncbi:MAG: hypothetical protein GW911_11040 [Armatimonadetes bacterium]|nr:hypothetical protein [Armatimonadota bacterium]NCP29031.1 hypothetical protein [Armatimonadota bacterium]NDK12568.1 hypothetical protein [Armatimonadota bacterium]
MPRSCAERSGAVSRSMCLAYHSQVWDRLVGCADMKEWAGTCPAGLTEVAAPVRVSGRPLAFVAAGPLQVRAGKCPAPRTPGKGEDRNLREAPSAPLHEIPHASAAMESEVERALNGVKVLADQVSQVANPQYRFMYAVSETNFYRHVMTKLQLLGDITPERIRESCAQALREMAERYGLTGIMLLTDYTPDAARRALRVIAGWGTALSAAVESPEVPAEVWSAAAERPLEATDARCQPLRRCFSADADWSNWWVHASPPLPEHPHRFMTLLRPRGPALIARPSYERRLALAAFTTFHGSVSRAFALLGQRERDRLHLETLARKRLLEQREELYLRAAHKIGNIAFGLWGSISALPKRLPQTSPEFRLVEQTVQEVRSDYEHLKRTLERLKQFARAEQLYKGPADLNGLVRGLVPADGGIEGTCVALALDDSLPPVEVDSEKLRAVLSELIQNSLVCLTAPGRSAARPGITITTKRVIEAHTVELRVADRGPGIAQEKKARIFEQFYTERPQGVPEGTGLGLTIAKEVVEAHGGTIRECGTPGQGAEFVITLPCRGDAQEDAL